MVDTDPQMRPRRQPSPTPVASDPASPMAVNDIATALATALSGLNIHKPDPPAFDGSGSVSDWLTAFKCTTGGSPDSERVRQLSKALRGSAFSWYASMLRRHEHSGTQLSFAEWEQLLTQHFGSSTTGLTSMLQQLRFEPSRPYVHYHNEVISLCSQLNPGMTDPEVVSHLLPKRTKLTDSARALRRCHVAEYLYLCNGISFSDVRLGYRSRESRSFVNRSTMI